MPDDQWWCAEAIVRPVTFRAKVLGHEGSVYIVLDPVGNDLIAVGGLRGRCLRCSIRWIVQCVLEVDMLTIPAFLLHPAYSSQSKSHQPVKEGKWAVLTSGKRSVVRIMFKYFSQTVYALQ